MSCFENQSRIASRNTNNRNNDGCGCNCENNGLIKTLETILRAQRIAQFKEEQEEFCDRTVLGPCTNEPNCNTRPIALYTCGGDRISIDFEVDGGGTTTSDVFRIEKIDNCVCTFRCLVPNTDPTSDFPYERTEEFFSVNYNCCCHILRCLDDTFVECL